MLWGIKIDLETPKPVKCACFRCCRAAQPTPPNHPTPIYNLISYSPLYPRCPHSTKIRYFVSTQPPPATEQTLGTTVGTHGLQKQNYPISYITSGAGENRSSTYKEHVKSHSICRHSPRRRGRGSKRNAAPSTDSSVAAPPLASVAVLLQNNAMRGASRERGPAAQRWRRSEI